MTREEQIDWLCRLKTDLNNGVIFTPWNKEFTEALNDVLEQESFINKPCVSSGVCEHDKNKVLDKIRAEIMQLDYDLDTVDYDYNDMTMTEEIHTICREEVLRIIDKYKTESENT